MQKTQHHRIKTNLLLAQKQGRARVDPRGKYITSKQLMKAARDFVKATSQAAARMAERERIVQQVFDRFLTS